MEENLPDANVEPIEGDFVEDHQGIHINGSSLEGGGQILRNSVTLSALLNKPVHIYKIRGKRPKPGLKAQHLHGLMLVEEMFTGVLKGGEVNSDEIRFFPSKPSPNDEFTADPGTAGSTGLLFQISLPCAVFAPRKTKLILKGGTNAIQAPQIDYTAQVFHPMVTRFGFDFQLNIEKRGYFPKGGGVVSVVTQPVKQLNAVQILNRGNIVSIRGRAFVSGKLPDDIAIKMKKRAHKILFDHFKDQNVELNIETVHEPAQQAVGEGVGIILVATTSTGCIIAGSALGERKKPADKVGEEAAQELLRNLSHGECVDEYLQDQLIIFMALANGTSAIRVGPIQLHTKTSMHFGSQFTGAKFRVLTSKEWAKEKGEEEPHGSEGSFIIECKGIGYQNPNM